MSLATVVDKSVFTNKTETIRPDFTARIDESPDDTMDAFCTATAVGVKLLYNEVTLLLIYPKNDNNQVGYY